MSFLDQASPRGRAARQRAIGRTVADIDTDAICANIREVYRAAHAFGAREWYTEANMLCREIATTYRLTMRQATGIVAALSPGTDWDRNLSLAHELAASRDCGHAYGDAIRKARAILDGADPDDVLGGRKVRSFWHNLLAPDSPGHVTVDRHALSLALLGDVQAPTDGRRTGTLSDRELKVLARPGYYLIIAGCYRKVARELGIAPHHLQSVTWDYWRTHKAYGVTTGIPEF